MKVYEFGESARPSILLLPGTCCYWKCNYGHVIQGLTKQYHVLCVSYDGFDETENTEFPDMVTEVTKIEDYIKKVHNGSIFAVYGSSLGGSFVGLLLQRKNIHIEHAIIGSSDFDQAEGFSAWLQTRLVVTLFYPMVHKGKVSKLLKNTMVKKYGANYTNSLIAMMIGTEAENKLSFIKKESIKNQFYSDLVTKIQDGIAVEGTKVHCFYATKMGEEYEKRYLKHFENPDIIRQDFNHEELLACYPKQWVEAVIKTCAESA